MERIVENQDPKNTTTWKIRCFLDVLAVIKVRK